MQRRRFLQLTAGMPLPFIVGACSDDPPAPAATSGVPSATTTPTPSASASSTPTARAATSTPPVKTATTPPSVVPTRTLTEYPVVAGSRPHDVAPRPGGGVWYTGQGNGTLGLLSTSGSDVEEVPLGAGSRPHGVIVGPDGHAWVTDGGLNSIVRVNDSTREITAFPLPASRPGANLNTGVFDRNGVHWFTGQTGVYGRVDPETGALEVFDAPRGRGPYGICSTPNGDVYYASLAGSYIAQIDLDSGEAMPVEPPTANQGARRVWSDSAGTIWVVRSGTPARSAAMTQRQTPGGSGGFPARRRRPTRCMWMSGT